MSKLKFIILGLFVFSYIKSYNQNILSEFISGKTANQIVEWQKGFGDQWFNKNIDKAVRVGAKIPAFSMGEIKNNPTGAKELADFKKKLIVLDFWDSHCGTCIAAFPKMKRLQEEFDKEIQIILVNLSETAEELKQSSISLKMPDLPSIFSPLPDLEALFPMRQIPYHVWIDGTGIVRLKGNHDNTYPEKIQRFLSGRKIDFRMGVNGAPSGPLLQSYYKLLGKQFKQSDYNYFFTEYNPYVDVMSHSDKSDSNKSTLRTTYLNYSILDLYCRWLSDSLSAILKKTIYSPYIHSPVFKMLTYVSLDVKDSLQYSSKFQEARRFVKESEKIRSMICYEQLAPVNWSDDQRRSLMLQDLNKHLGKLYGTNAIIKKKTVPCYVLKRTSRIDRLSVKKSGERKFETGWVAIEKDGEMMLRSDSKGNSLTKILSDAVYRGIIPDSIFRDKIKGGYVLWIDETGDDFLYNVRNPEISFELYLPSKGSIKDINDLRKALRKSDLDIVKEDRIITVVEITDRTTGS